jgi:hypothetical protein
MTGILRSIRMGGVLASSVTVLAMNSSGSEWARLA